MSVPGWLLLVPGNPFQRLGAALRALGFVSILGLWEAGGCGAGGPSRYQNSGHEVFFVGCECFHPVQQLVTSFQPSEAVGASAAIILNQHS